MNNDTFGKMTFPGLYINRAIKFKHITDMPPEYPEGWNRLTFQPKTGMGLLYRSRREGKPTETFNYNEIKVEFIDYWPTDVNGKPCKKVRASYSQRDGIDTFSYKIIYVHISKINIKELKRLELWGILSDEERVILETKAYSAPVNNDEHTRGKKRNPEFANLPRSLVCSVIGCDNKQDYISPTILLAKAEADNVTPEEWVYNWKCSECKPRRKGKRIDPATANLPRSFLCSTEGCEEVLKYISPTMLVSKAAEMGISTDEYIAQWKCSICIPRHRGRAPSAKWLGLPRELTCDCGKVTKQHPSATDKLAKEAGMTFDEYVAAYQCRKCRPASTNTTTTRGRKMSPNSPWFGFAKEVVCCECDKVQKQHASITDGQAKKAGKTFEEYRQSWKCMDCRPVGEKRVRKNSKPANPLYAEIPKETICVECERVVKLVPANIVEKAEILEISVADLVGTYKCRSCGGKITKADREKHEKHLHMA